MYHQPCIDLSYHQALPPAPPLSIDLTPDTVYAVYCEKEDWWAGPHWCRGWLLDKEYTFFVRLDFGFTAYHRLPTTTQHTAIIGPVTLKSYVPQQGCTQHDVIHHYYITAPALFSSIMALDSGLNPIASQGTACTKLSSKNNSVK